MSIKIVNICDVCEEIFAGGDAPKKHFSEIKTTEFSIPIYSNGEAKQGLYGYTNFSRVNVPSITVSARGTIGYTAIRYEPFVPIVRLITLVPDTDIIDIKYLYYATQNYRFVDSGTSIPQLTVPMLKKYSFPLPIMEKQKQIADELDKVTDLIRKRKEQLKKLDELVKARFVELFGDCEHTVRLGDCCEVHARIGWQALTKDEHMKTGEYMLVTGTDFIDGEINYSTCVYVAKERYEMDKHIILKNDDVLITKDGTIGKVAIVHNLPKPATLNAGVFVVRPDERFNKEYIANVFKGPLFSDYVEASKTGATIKHLNQKHLVEFMIPVPSLAEQGAFAKFTQQTDKSKLEVQKSLEKLELLKKALMQKYFG